MTLAIRVRSPVVPPSGGRHEFRLKTERSTAAGFTLIELLVVIGLIAVLVGGFGLSLADKSGTSLATAQQSVAALCGTARAQAALHQTETRVLVHATRTATAIGEEKYLRLLQVFRAEPADSNSWIAAGAPLYLPRGVYVVPPNLLEHVATGIDWANAAFSTSTLARMAGPEVPAGTEFADAGSVLCVQFSPEGVASGDPGQPQIRIMLAAAARTGDGPRFGNPAAVRGVVMRANGSIGFVHDATGF